MKEVVIKITDELYDHIKEGLVVRQSSEYSDIDALLEAVDCGIVLPKGHGDLKDADELKKNAIQVSDYTDAEAVWIDDIDEASTIKKKAIKETHTIIKADKLSDNEERGKEE